MTRRPIGRPHGEIHRVLLDAWRAQGPAPTRDIAARTQVGMQAAHRTASRMVAAGDLVVVRAGRPAALAVPEHPQAKHQAKHQAMPSILSFWELPLP